MEKPHTKKPVWLEKHDRIYARLERHLSAGGQRIIYDSFLDYKRGKRSSQDSSGSNR